METYSVIVHKRPLGIGLISTCDSHSSGNNEEVVISEVHPNSKGYELGLTIGDTLIAINDKRIKSIDDYYDHKLPFNLTFRKSDIVQSTLIMPIVVPKNQNRQRNYHKRSQNRNKKTGITIDLFNNIKQVPLPPIPQSASIVNKTPKGPKSSSVPMATFKGKKRRPKSARKYTSAKNKTAEPKYMIYK